MPPHQQSWRAANYRMLGTGPGLDFLPCCPLGLLTLNPCSVPRKPRTAQGESERTGPEVQEQWWQMGIPTWPGECNMCPEYTQASCAKPSTLILVTAASSLKQSQGLQEYLLISHSAQSTQVSSLLLKHTRQRPTSGPLHWLFALPRTSSPKYALSSFPTLLFQAFAQTQLLRGKLLLTTQSLKCQPLTPLFPFSAFSFSGALETSCPDATVS